MNRIYCPIENGWAERINRARKPHKCTRCYRTITEGSSYVLPERLVQTRTLRSTHGLQQV